MEEFLETPKAAPSLNIPKGAVVVDVRIINTTSYAKGKAAFMLSPGIKGHEYVLLPSFAFLISHPHRSKHVLFDLGIRKDWKTGVPEVMAPFLGSQGEQAKLYYIDVEKDVHDIFEQHSDNLKVTSSDIEAVIWSHHHFDHAGDMTRFTNETSLVVGPHTIQTYLPGCPENPKSRVNQIDFQDRQVKELKQDDFTLDIGGLPAHDFFGDGSFYLLSCEGHAVGHINGLARVESGDSDSFVLLGGDTAHHGGDFRPSVYQPLPRSIQLTSPYYHHTQDLEPGSPIKLTDNSLSVSGAKVRDQLHPKKSATETFYEMAKKPGNYDADKACQSMLHLQAFDANDDVLVCIGHDLTLLNHVSLYPDKLNNWKSLGIKEKVRWDFLRDFDLSGCVQ